MAKKKVAIDEMLRIIDNNTIQYDILLAIKKGMKWENKKLQDMFMNVKSMVGDPPRVWLPRHIQVDIGKASNSYAVLKGSRTAGSKKKAIYQSIDDYVHEHDDLPKDNLIVSVFMIHCRCGISFIGKEPEHQLHCTICKMRIPSNRKTPKESLNQNPNSELLEQLNTMLRILYSRDITDSVRDRVLTKLRRDMITSGLSNEEIEHVISRHSSSGK